MIIRLRVDVSRWDRLLARVWNALCLRRMVASRLLRLVRLVVLVVRVASRLIRVDR